MNVQDRLCGVVPEFFDQVQLTNMARIFSHAKPTHTLGNDYHGIGSDHPGALFVRRQLLAPIADHFDTDPQLIFAFFLECVTPLRIHQDLTTVPDPQGQPYLSFVIPVSVDNDPAKCHRASTLIMDQWDYEDMDDLPAVDNNVQYLHGKELSHVPLEWCSKFTLKKQVTWNAGDLIWWDSRLAHASDNFLLNGCTSKQAIVMHTYLL